VKTFLEAISQVEPSVPYLQLEPPYVTGLCEGEASFTYGRQGDGLRLRFAVKLHESDQALIFALKTFFGVGGVYRTGTAWQYVVTDTYELSRLATHFDAYPLKGSKGEVYRIWRKMLRLKLSNEALNWAEMQSLALQLSAMALKGRRKPENG